MFSECRTLWAKILKLNLHTTIRELEKRNLKSAGKLPELKSRLIRYIKGNTLISDLNKEHTPKYKTMSDIIPFCQPNKFSDAIHENVD